jgi:hypothetical protein
VPLRRRGVRLRVPETTPEEAQRSASACAPACSRAPRCPTGAAWR